MKEHFCLLKLQPVLNEGVKRNNRYLSFFDKTFSKPFYCQLKIFRILTKKKCEYKIRYFKLHEPNIQNILHQSFPPLHVSWPWEIEKLNFDRQYVTISNYKK